MTKSSLLIFLAALVALAGCEVGFPAGSTPVTELNFTNMGDQPKLKPQRRDLFGENVVGMTAPAEGAVAMGVERPYRFKVEEAKEAEAFYTNPMLATPETLTHGEWIFTNFCIVCHGSKAAGDGHLTKLFPKPPHLMRQKVRDFPDGRIFHIANRGQASMPSYAKQLEAKDIWSVIHYIRNLQASSPVAPPSDLDLKELEELKKKQAAEAAAKTDTEGAVEADSATPAAPTPAGEQP